MRDLPGLKREIWGTRLRWYVEFAGGLVDVGFAGDGFCFDNELPRHRVWLEPFALAIAL